MKLSAILLFAVASPLLLLAGGRTPVFFSLDGERFAGTDLSRWVHYERQRILLDAGLTIEFAGANPDAKPEGLEPAEARISAFLGRDPAHWKAGEGSFRSIVYRNLYPAIDLICRQGPKGIKSDFVLHPGADPLAIRIRYKGAKRVAVRGAAADGALSPSVLEIETESGVVRDEIPEVYQIRAGQKQVIQGSYVIHGDQTVGFGLTGYDPAFETVIDPQLLVAAYWAGNQSEAITAVAYAADSTMLIGGWTESSNLPSVNPVQTRFGGSTEGFVARLAADGVTIQWATMIGGLGADRVTGITFDDLGAVIIAGQTGSFDFPVRFGMQDTLRGSQDGFVAKIEASGTSLRWATYFGGSGVDAINGVASGPNEKIYIGGQTTSLDLPTKNPIRSALSGSLDGFIARMNQDGRSLDYGTYWGGTGNDVVSGISYRNQEAYVTGWTDSTNFPVGGGFQMTNRGGTDAFVSKLNFVGTSMVYSSYLGGYNGSPGLPETGNGIAVNGAGEAIVVGVTASPNFWLASPARDWYARGGADGFVTKVSASGSSLAYSTYLGGTGFDIVNAVAVRPTGETVVVGMTSSTDFHPLHVLLGHGGMWDGFITQFSNTGQIQFSTPWGGAGSDSMNAVAIHPSSNLIVVGGSTQSVNLPVTTGTAGTVATHGFYGIFSLNLTGGGVTPAVTVSVGASTVRVTQGGSSQPVTVTVAAQGGYTGTVTLSAIDLPSGVTATFVPTAISGGAGTSLMTLTASGSATLGVLASANVLGSGAGITTATSTDFTVEVAATNANAEIAVDLTGTGVNVSGGRDLSYAIRTGATTLPAFAVVQRPATWITGAGADWIAPAPNQVTGSPAGTYSFDTNFDLTSSDSSTAVIEGVWSVAGQLRIRLNGQLMFSYVPPSSPANDSYGVLHPFRLDSGFVAGINTVTFEVTNPITIANTAPTGLRVEVTKASVRSSGNTATIPVYGTGVQSYGSSVALYPIGNVDPRWVLALSPDPSYPGGVAPKIAQPAPGWISGDAPVQNPNYGARWIAPRVDPVNGNAASNDFYVYYQVLDLTGIDKNTALVKGRWASDNESEVRIRRRSNGYVPSWPSATAQPKNTNPQGQPAYSYSTFTNFAIPPSLLVDGEDNLIEFAVKNPGTGPSPTGLIVEFDGHPAGRKMPDFYLQPAIFTTAIAGSLKQIPVPIVAANNLGWTRPVTLTLQQLIPNPWGMPTSLLQNFVSGTGTANITVSPVGGQPPGDYLFSITANTADTGRPLRHTKYFWVQVR